MQLPTTQFPTPNSVACKLPSSKRKRPVPRKRPAVRMFCRLGSWQLRQLGADLRSTRLPRRRRLGALAAGVGLAALAALGARRLAFFAGAAPSAPSAPSSPSPAGLPRRRSAAARRRPPTPLAFGLAASAAAFSASAFGLYSLPTSSICAISAAVAAAEAEAQDARVAARPRLEARRDRVEQLGDDVAVLDVAQDEAPRVQRPGVGVSRGDAALGDGDDPLDERTQLLRLRHRRLDALVPDQRLRLVAEHRDPVLGDAAQFSLSNSVTHDSLVRRSVIPAMPPPAGRAACRG